jgi:hypothetical protein
MRPHCPLKMVPFEVDKVTGKLMDNAFATKRIKR